jgi:hypothetical protein
MNKYILTFESYSKRKKKNKKRIWDELLKIKPRTFKSVKVEPEVSLNNPDMMIPSTSEVG